jgi:helicase-like protein
MAELLDRQLAVRDDLCRRLRLDLIGPNGSETETLDQAPLNRYVTGILYPRIDGAPSEQILDPGEEDETADDGGDAEADPAIALSNVQYPSSAGISFAVREDVERLLVTIEAARYVEEVEEDGEGGKRRSWIRNPIGPLEHTIEIAGAVAHTTEVVPKLDLFWQVREPTEGGRSVTVVLINRQNGERTKKDGTSFFQVSFKVEGKEAEAPFVARPEKIDVDDEDLSTNALLYRNTPEFAVGHGCSAAWNQIEGTRTADEVSATFMPTEQTLIVRSNPEIDVTGLGFDALAAASRSDLVASLDSFAAGYSSWIEARKLDALALDGDLAETASGHLDECARVRDGILEGVGVLREDDAALRAFRLANRAMADQMERSAAHAGSDIGREEFLWRPFQLAFVLLAMPSTVDRGHPDRNMAELLWFPTGGGKTEAYLGLFAFTVFHRRITGSGGGGGVTAIMRYTLRLLTSQQFERASRVICACERIRREEDDLGSEPISIGLFVGSASTPSMVKEAKEALKKLRSGKKVATRNPVQLHRCPWCDVAIDHRNYTIRENPKRLQIECRGKDCDFAEGLPVWVVDEDLYRVRPSLVIGTVDKFAALPWRPEVGNLFNLGDSDDAPPDLIIQDELHLISGPLGTMSGLYETAVDLLSEKDGVLPKVIASTATIRRAKDQSRHLFDREMRQFPPPGLDPGDSWFATTAPGDEVGPRRYVGLMAPGVSHASLMIRCYAALLNAAGTHPPDAAVDPYWTLIGYFNSLRVLGAARMQVQDDVHEWLKIAAGPAEPRRLGEPSELTSRVESSEIPAHLNNLEVALPKDETLDVVLATNMISVGVDVDRLGLMVVMGQPQATAEYIQATSRVGRKHPGLVVTLLNSARSRDRSHYEAFAGFHTALYKTVEASSVTPFSPRARDRGLHAVLIALARLKIPALYDNDHAGAVGDHLEEVEALSTAILQRVEEVDADKTDGTRGQLQAIVETWVQLAEDHPNLVYESRSGEKTALLSTAAPDLEQSTFSTMWSLRNVDAVSNLFQIRIGK